SSSWATMPPSTRPLRRWCGTSRRSSGSALPRLCGRTDASALQTGCVRATRRAPVTGFHPRSSSVPSRFSESLDTCNGRRYLCLPDRIREVSCVAAAGWCDARLGAEHRRVSFRHPVEQEGIVIHLPGESRRTPRRAAVVLTGYADEDLGLEALREGAQDYLVKGEIDGRQLSRTIRYAMERAQTEARMRYLAFHDVLTGLVNRTLFTDRLGHALDRLARGDA